MAVTEQTPRNVSTAAPGATVFPYDFKIIASTDMLVEVDAVAKTLGVDYTLSGVGLDIGGNVTFVVPLVGGETVVRKREMPFTRETDYQNLGDLRSPTLNNDQDAPVMMIQQLADDLSRALRLPISSTASAELPELVALMPLVVSADGTSIVIGDTNLTGDMLLRGALQAISTGLGLSLNGTAAGAAINQLRTGQHFAQNGARIHRLNDRLFIGAATQNDGAFPNVGRCWMDDLWVLGGFGTGPGASAATFIANDTDPNNAIGLLSAVQTKDFTSAGTTGIGGFSCVFNNHATLATKVYGHYIEAHRTTAATADTYGLEVDTRTLKATLQPTPRQLGDVACLQLASGAEWSATGQFDASCFIQMARNPMRAKVGINVMHDALVDIGGGVTEFVGLPSYSLISWFDSAGLRSGFVTSLATSKAAGTSLALSNNQVNINSTDTAGALQFAFVTASAAVNYMSFYSATAGNGVRILAGGTDATIDVSVEPKGAAGRFKIGTASTAATTPASFSAARYLPIKDSSGTVYYVPLATAVW